VHDVLALVHSLYGEMGHVVGAVRLVLGVVFALLGAMHRHNGLVFDVLRLVHSHDEAIDVLLGLVDRVLGVEDVVLRSGVDAAGTSVDRMLTDVERAEILIELHLHELALAKRSAMKSSKQRETPR
jgi:hypothetical protein